MAAKPTPVKVQCRLCAYVWTPRVEKPKSCPRCHAYIRADREEQ